MTALAVNDTIKIFGFAQSPTGKTYKCSDSIMIHTPGKVMQELRDGYLLVKTKSGVELIAHRWQCRKLRSGPTKRIIQMEASEALTL